MTAHRAVGPVFLGLAPKTESSRILVWRGLGTMAEGGPGGAKATIDFAVRLSTRSFERIQQAMNTIHSVHGLGTIDVLRHNAAAVIALLLAVEERLADEKLSPQHVDWHEVHFEIRASATNWVTAWGAYRDHCRSRHAHDSRALARLSEAQSREFDASERYRLAEKLRNYVTHVGLPPLRMHVSSKLNDASQEVRSWTCDFDPAELLESWDEWGAPVRRDLEASDDAIAIADVVERSMTSVERLEALMQDLERPARRRAARVVLRAAERLGDLEGTPCAFHAEWNATEQRLHNASPMPLPVEDARAILNIV